MKKNSLFLMASIALSLFVSCSSDDDRNTDDNDFVRKERVLTLTQSSNTNSSDRKKTILKDLGEDGVYASWEMNDKATIYNKSYPAAGYMIVTASSSTKDTHFKGTVNCGQGDVLRMFYPEVNNGSSVKDTNNSGVLTLDISNQKGTLEDIQLNYDFCYGEATVTDVTETTATADMGSTENLMTICKFTFKCDNNYLKSIKKVKITGVHEKGVFTLSASNPELTRCQFANSNNSTKKRNVKTNAPEFSEIEQSQGLITINTDNVDNSVYVALYPGSTTPTFEVINNEGIYEGALTTSNLQAGKYYNVVVNMTKTSNVNDYVEVCGIKWAKGNLQYDPVNGGDEGFMENWRIAPAQWHFVGYDRIDNYDPKSEVIKDNFYKTYLGQDAYNYDRAVTQSYTIDISSKLFYSEINDNNVLNNNFYMANYGDLAFWASNGKYRLPQFIDIQILINEASRQYGYVNVADNIIYGYLFTTPEGEQTINTTPILFTENKLSDGLFLPFGGCVCYSSTRQNPESNRIYKTYYVPSVHAYVGSVDHYGILLSSSSVSNSIVYGKTVLGQWNNCTNYYYYANKIRPVLCQ